MLINNCKTSLQIRNHLKRSFKIPPLNYLITFSKIVSPTWQAAVQIGLPAVKRATVQANKAARKAGYLT